jgi:hypothetical protein
VGKQRQRSEQRGADAAAGGVRARRPSRMRGTASRRRLQDASHAERRTHQARTLRLADGPDEVHKGVIARIELT